jgi:cytidine deaminase
VTEAVDWDALRARAREVAALAYAPYSGVRVGAAALIDDGRVVVGCNVENASIGLTTCAENGVASALAATGGGHIVALAVVAGDGEYLAPCGRCRQVLSEFADPDMVVDAGPDGTVTLGELLPGAFRPSDLADRRDIPPLG